MTNGQGQAPTCVITYDVIRNLTSSPEKENGVQTWFANVPASQILKIGTGDNLRAYIAEHSAGKRNGVHRQIAATIERAADRFINRNSGVTITCTNAVVDDNAKTIKLRDASIINGAQTQGEIKRYFDLNDDEAEDFLLRAEIIMEPSHDAIVEIAIARNTATAVKSVSQASARGYLEALKASVEAGLPGETLQENETDAAGLNTQMVLQHARLLMPPTLMNGRTPPKNFAYKQGGKCLADFSEWARLQKEGDPNAKELHDFMVQIAPIAIKEYRRWEAHDAWNGHRLHERGKASDKPVGGRPVRRDKKTNKVVWVAPGILFPVMSSLSAFVRQKDGKWVLEKPSLFKEEELIRRAVQQFRALGREVAMMGRNEQAYDALSIYTETIASVLASQ